MIIVKKGDIIRCRLSTQWGEDKGMYLARVLNYKQRRVTPVYLEAIMSFRDGLKVPGAERHYQISDVDVHKNFGNITFNSIADLEEEYPEWAI